MDNSTPRITEKEVREIYENLPKERLVEILVAHFKERQDLYDQIPRMKGLPVELLK